MVPSYDKNVIEAILAGTLYAHFRGKMEYI